MKRRFNLNMPLDLFKRIKVMAELYGISITQMIINLLEVGYLKMIGDDVNGEIKH